jgi:hypothetical protein
MQCGELQFMLILDLWVIRFNPVVVVGSDYDFLVKSILRHCGSPAAILKIEMILWRHRFDKNSNDIIVRISALLNKFSPSRIHEIFLNFN